jgi:3-carboxy-cis,cis-muconate cycloisomerase
VNGLYDPLFGDDDAARWFTPPAHVQAMLDVEAALADALADAGVAPARCATVIRGAARAGDFDLAAIAVQAADAGNVAIPLVRQLTDRVEAADPEAARYVHRGATSQDILDTALVIQLRGAVQAIRRHLDRAAAAAAEQARRHRLTLMAGRTWMQQAAPITFGLKAAGWVDAVERASHRLDDALDRASVLQLGGAAGTLAALGPAADRVGESMARLLGLERPSIPWHAYRDRLAELASALGIAAGILGKIGRDLSLLAQTEVGEAEEARKAGRGGSSTMPQKHNPVAASVAIAAALRAPGLVATLLAALPNEHERGLGGWQAEWETIPELVVVTAGSARTIAHALEALAVDPDRMGANLAASGGALMAEAVAAALADRIGRRNADRRVRDAVERASRDGRSLADALAADEEIAAHMDRHALETSLSPERYLGEAATFIDRVLARWQRS